MLAKPSTSNTLLLLVLLLALLVALAIYTPFSNEDDTDKLMTTADQTIEVIHNPQNSASIEHAIIWLHGLGASSNDFPPVVPALGLDPQRAIRFVFPQAPDRPITINGGMVMPGWYDIRGMSIDDKEDLEGMQQSQQTLDSLIQQQLDLGVPGEQIIIAGFSQGGAVAYYTGIRSQRRLGGILALSTYLPFTKDAAEQHSGVNTETAIFANHGTQDPVVPVQLGQMSAEALNSLGYNVEWKTYPMQHQVVIEQLQDIGHWINRTFSVGDSANQ